jgi:integrase
MLRGAFAWASTSGILADEWPNPCHGAKRIKEVYLDRCVYERREQINRLVTAVVTEGVEWKVAALLGFECGLRVDEIAHLTWRSVDMQRREVVVQPEADGWAPKGTCGRLAMTDMLHEAMSRLDRSGALRVVGGESPGGFVRRFRARLRRACAQAGLPIITPHGLRRTFATILANSGMQPQQLQRVMRHADIQTTLKFYVRLDERAAAAEARRRIEEAL